MKEWIEILIKMDHCRGLISFTEARKKFQLRVYSEENLYRMRDKGGMKRKGKSGKRADSCKTRYQRINQNWEINF